jgi:hypothetical protein
LTLLLDTNVISDLRRRRRDNARLFQWRASLGDVPTYISAITLLEIEFGATQAFRQRAPHAPILRRWIDDWVLVEFDGAVLPVDVAVAQQCARLQAIRTFPHNDALIAATALVYDLTLVTRDVWDFEHSGVRLLNPWDA